MKPNRSFMKKSQILKNSVVYSAVAVLAGIAFSAVLIPSSYAKTYSADIIVYGDTSAAVVTAVQAKKEGKNVILVAPLPPLGAMTSSGLGVNHFFSKC